MKTPVIPDLEHGCGSWMATSPSGQVIELYERSNVAAAAMKGWTIETAMTYLCRINKTLTAARGE